MFKNKLHSIVIGLVASMLINLTGCTTVGINGNNENPIPVEQSKDNTDIDTNTKDESNNQNNSDVQLENGKDNNDKTNNETNKDNNEPINNEPINNDTQINNNSLPSNSTVTQSGIVANPDAIDVVVNKKCFLPSDYVPSDLVKLSNVPTCLANPEVNQLRKAAAEALTKMFNAAKEENVILVARSGYRSYNTQVSLYNSYVKNHGQEAADKFSARPGSSEHQTGLCIDVTADSVNLTLSSTFGDTTEGKWLAENAHKYGFIIRYPSGKEEITGYIYEPWHIRYLGEDTSKKVYESGLTLDEYMLGENR